MTGTPADSSPELTLFDGADSKGFGNLIYKSRSGDSEELLKLYRPRWRPLQELSQPLVARLLGTVTARDANSRHETERACLTLWAREGFDVPRLIDKPLPTGFEPPGLWMEYCPGTTLSDLFWDQSVPWEQKEGYVKRLAKELGRRHQRAVELSEPLLLQKHGNLVHIMLTQDRLVTFDLEGSFRPSANVIEAIAQELSGYLRSIANRSEGYIDEAFRAFVDAYPDKPLLKEVTHWAVYGKSLHRFVTRWSDKRRRSKNSKTEVMARVHSFL